MDAESVQIIGDLYVNLVRARGEILRLRSEIERLQKSYDAAKVALEAERLVRAEA